MEAHLQALRQLPKVDRVAAELPEEVPLTVRSALARRAVQAVRMAIGQADPAAIADPVSTVRGLAEGQLASLRSAGPETVINATGTVLHTGLGRAALSERAIAAAEQALRGYCRLEFNLASGERGNRQHHVAPLLEVLTGAEAALVVNNCAAATVLALQALAKDRAVVVSRGELVEIGGSFRVPEIMAAAGCQLVEVGATNKTHDADYRRALEHNPALLLQVHRSNFVQEGFVASVDTHTLADIAHEAGIPLMVDQGSGCMVDLRSHGYSSPTVQQVLADGADLVCCSGDKLFGGPQAGIILGRADLVAACARHPLARAMRCDKVTLAALAGTLKDYLLDEPFRAVPTLAALAADPTAVRNRCQQVIDALPAAGLEIRKSRGAVGSGALPTAGPESYCLVILGPAERSHRALRGGRPAVVGRIHGGHLLLDLATVSDGELPALISRLGDLDRQR